MMLMTYDNQDEKCIRRELEELMPLFEVRRLLNVSWYRMMEIVKSGVLPVYNVSAEPMKPETITDETRGLRVLPSDVKAYIQSIKL